VAAEEADTAVALLKEAGESPYIVGDIKAGDKGVTLC